MTPLAPLITSFLRDYMPHQRGYSPRTCETYAVSFKLLLEFAARRTGTRPSRLFIEQLDAPLIIDFLAHVERERGNGAATRNLRLAAIKAFMRYVEHRVPSALEQIGQIDAIPVKRHDQKLIRHLTMEEVRAILNAPDLTTRSGVRDRAMMHLCFAGGLRVSELVGVLLENITLGRTPSVMVRGKGRKERCLPLWKETARDLRAWLSVRGAMRAPEVFVNAEGTAMTRAGFEYVLDKHVRIAAKSCAVAQRPRSLPTPASAQLRRDHAAGNARHPEGSTVARARRHPHDRGLSPHGSQREARSGRGGGPAGAATRSVQGTRCVDRFSVGGHSAVNHVRSDQAGATPR